MVGIEVFKNYRSEGIYGYHTYEKAFVKVEFKLNQMPDRSQTLIVWRREGFLLYSCGFIAKHLFVFTLKVSQYHAYDNRRPSQLSGLILGPCAISGYALSEYCS
jgi:hypothetical protein